MAKRFLTKAIRRHGGPEKAAIDGSEANASALRTGQIAYGTAIVIRQVKDVNHVIEQEHRRVQQETHPR